MTNKTKAFAYVNSKEAFSNTYLVDFNMLNICKPLSNSKKVCLTPFIFYNETDNIFYSIDIIKTEDGEKLSTQIKYTEISGEYLEKIKQDISDNSLVELSKCVNSNDKINSSEVLSNLLDKINNAIIKDPSTSMNTFMIESITKKSSEVNNKQNEIYRVKHKLKKIEKQQKEVNLITLSMQNELFLK